MTKFYGVVGYAVSTEVKMGVWEDVITEKKHYGDVVRNSRRYVSNAELNDDLSLSVSISILADPFALANISRMRFVELEGALWSITNVEPQRPRLVLSLGGVYNGPRANPSGTASSPA